MTLASYLDDGEVLTKAPMPEQIFVAWPRWYNDGSGYAAEGHQRSFDPLTEKDFFTPPPPSEETSWGGVFKQEQITPKDYGLCTIEVMSMNGGEVEVQRDGSIAIHWGIADGPDIAIIPLTFAPMVRLFKDYDKAMDYAQRTNQALYAMQALWVERATKIVTAAKTILADIVITTVRPSQATPPPA